MMLARKLILCHFGDKELKMEFKKLMTAAALLSAITFGASAASANTGAGAAFDAHYTVKSNCFSCHTGSPGTLLQLGLDWVSAGGDKNSGPSSAAGWDTLDATYLATYGPVEPTWTAPAASSSSSGGGCLTGSVATPLMILLGM